MEITEIPFLTMADGRTAHLYSLTNGQGMTAQITNYGGILVSLHTPDRTGQPGDVVLGFDQPSRYLDRHPFFGALVGRYANRIAGAHFSLDGVNYSLAANNGSNHLHGGLKGFDKELWTTEISQDAQGARLQLSLESPDGNEGYPGRLSVTVTYTLSPQNELSIDYHAVTDKATIINLTNHSYFNLSNGSDILSHVLTLNADHFTPGDAQLIPTGEVRDVTGSPMDFRQPTLIGARIREEYDQLTFGQGYDHNWVINKESGQLGLAAQVTAPDSGRRMQLWTTKPGVQFYTGNTLPILPGKGGRTYRPNSGFCLETQFFPDSPHHAHFPSSVLRPGQVYAHTTRFGFDTI